MVLEPPERQEGGDREYDESEASFSQVDMNASGEVYDHDGNFLGSVTTTEDSNVLDVEQPEQAEETPEKSLPDGVKAPDFELRSTVFDLEEGVPGRSRSEHDRARTIAAGIPPDLTARSKAARRRPILKVLLYARKEKN